MDEVSSILFLWWKIIRQSGVLHEMNKHDGNRRCKAPDVCLNQQ